MSNIDARVRYTRMVIEKCFLDLLEKKPANRITVTELCQMAEINRATFYKHYLDIPDLLEKMEGKMLGDIRALFQECDDIQKAFLKMLQYAKMDFKKYAFLGSENGDRELFSKICNVCFESAYPMTETNLPQLDNWQRETLHAYITYGIAGIMKSWIMDGMAQPPEKVADIMASLCKVVIDGVREGRVAL